MGNLGICNFRVYSRSPIETLDKITLVDYQKDYEFQGADVELVYVSIPSTEPSSPVSLASENRRFKGKIESFTLNREVFNVSAREFWFRDKEISRRLTKQEFPNLDDESDGDYGSLVFGTDGEGGARGINVPGAHLGAATDGVGDASQMFFGWAATDGVEEVTYKELDPLLPFKPFIKNLD